MPHCLVYSASAGTDDICMPLAAGNRGASYLSESPHACFGQWSLWVFRFLKMRIHLRISRWNRKHGSGAEFEWSSCFGLKGTNQFLQYCEEGVRPFAFKTIVLRMSSLLTLPCAVILVKVMQLVCRLCELTTCCLHPEKKVKKSDCGEWQWSVCVPTSGDCGLGTREGTRTGAECKQTTKTQKCKIPCNWKKQFGGQHCSLKGFTLVFILSMEQEACNLLSSAMSWWRC